MTEPDKRTGLEFKLQSLKELFKDIKTEAPGVLKEFLEDYKYLFDDGGNDENMESSKCVDASSQTEDENQWNLANIIEDVTDIAEKATLETGFNYDAKSGWYFDANMNCYYNPDYRLYYYRDRNAYYYYDQESNELKFYCSLTSENDSLNVDGSNLMEFSNHSKDGDQDPQPSGINMKPDDGFDPSSECNEEGECSESEEDAQIKSPTISEAPLNPNLTPIVIEAGPTVFEPDNTKHFAPCIRIVVMSSTLPEFSYGTLFIVTCTGGTIGREGNHDVLIPDQLVSKMHGKFQYVLKDGSYAYELIDLGSKNGTYVNGKRLSDSLIQSGPATISHGSVITVGCTDLLCHIHPNDETCSLCSVFSSVNIGQATGSETEGTLNEKRHKQALTIKKKFGIQSSSIKLPEGYEDRAEVRRKQVGSSHSSEKTETASVNEPICKRNKGYNLLSKMGWKEGEALGKNNEGGTLEPILPAERINPISGLGCKASNLLNGKSKKNDIAMKTFERYNKIYN